MHTRKPFHETVIDAISEATTWDEMDRLGRLINSTKIPKGHDEIIKAWDHQQLTRGLDFRYMQVSEGLLEQKLEIAEQHKEMSEAIRK